MSSVDFWGAADELLPQQPLQDLPRRVARQLVDEVDGHRLLEAGQLVPAEVEDLLAFKALVGADDDRDRRLAPLLALAADDADSEQVWKEPLRIEPTLRITSSGKIVPALPRRFRLGRTLGQPPLFSRTAAQRPTQML